MHKNKTVKTNGGKKRKVTEDEQNQENVDETKCSKALPDESLSESFFEEWDEDRVITSTQKSPNQPNNFVNVEDESISEQMRIAEDILDNSFDPVGESLVNETNDSESEQPTFVNVDLNVALGKITLLESKSFANDQTIQSLNDEIETLKKASNENVEENNSLKEDIHKKNGDINMLHGKVSSLEFDNKLKTEKLTKYNKIMRKMNEEVKRLRQVKMKQVEVVLVTVMLIKLLQILIKK